MAYQHAANVIIVDSEETLVPGPVDIVAVEASGTASISKGGATVMDLVGTTENPAYREVSLRSASGFSVDPGAGEVRLYLRLHY